MKEVKLIKFSKVIAILLGSIVIFSFVAWNILSSSVFSKYASGWINKYLKKHSDIVVSYGKVNAKLFPPGITILDVKAETKKKLGDFEKLSISARRIDIDAKIFTVEWDRIQIGSIELSDAEIFFQHKSSKNKESEFDFWKYFKYEQIFNLMKFDKFQIHRVGINNSRVSSNYADAVLKELSWERMRASIEIGVGVVNAKIKEDALSQLSLNEKNLNKIPQIDLLKVNAVLGRKNINIENFTLESDQQRIETKAFVENAYIRKKMRYVANGQLSLILDKDEIGQSGLIIPNLKKFGIFSFGSKNKFKVLGDDESYSIAGTSDIESLETKYGDFSFASISWLVDKSQFAISDIYLKDKAGGVAKSKNTDIRVDLTKPSLMDLKGEVLLEGISLSNALEVVPAVSHSLKGQANGTLYFSFDLNTHETRVFSKESLVVNSFVLQTGNAKELLSIKELKVLDTSFVIGKGVSFLGNIAIGDQKVGFDGSINQDTINVKTDSFLLDLNKINKIAGIQTEGLGQFNLLVTGNTSFPKMIFQLKDVQRARIFDFGFGTLNAKIVIDFVRKAIIFENVKSQFQTGIMQGDGYISLEDFVTDISIRTSNLSSQDLLNIHKRLFPWDLSWFEKVISTSNINYKISGKINELSELNVKADMKMERVTWNNEEIYDLSCTILFKEKILSIPDISFKKGKGIISAGLSYDINEDVFRSVFKSKNLEATDLFFYNSIKPSFNSNLTLEGAYKKSKVGSEGVFNVIATNSRLNDEEVQDSYIAIQWKDGVAKVQGRYAENWVKLNSQIDFNQSNNDVLNKSFATVSINVPNWGRILSLFGSFDINDPILAGRLHVESDALFNVQKIRNADIDFKIKDLVLSHPSLQVKKTPFDTISVVNGEIKKWDLQVKGIGGDQFISRAYGNIAKFAEIENVFDFSLSKLNYFLGSYLDLNGFVQSQLKVRVSQNDFTYLGKIKSDDAVLNSKKIVSTLGKTKIQIDFDNKEIKLVNFISTMGSGNLFATGIISRTDGLYPAVTLKYTLNNAKIQFGSRSMTTLTGQGLVMGTKPPYVINGDIRLSNTEVFNEPSDFEFSSSKKVASSKFLPDKSSKTGLDLILFNISAVTESPVIVRNSIAELNLISNVQLTNKISDPRLSGNINLKTDKKNVLIIKNNQFKVNRLNVSFDPRQSISNPSLDIDADSFISQYTVRAKISGAAKNYNLDLSAEPALSRQSILSLIAFGYAENLNQNMSNEDREALSSAGLGAFIFDQLKLNERLHSNLGLTLNVGTEYLSTSSSMLQGRSQQTGSMVGQLRTATKLELRKKVDDKIGLSVSSTVGGSAGQKQSMNLNYLINKNVSLDAIYELNTDVSSANERTGKSAGGDIKFRWTFK